MPLGQSEYAKIIRLLKTWREQAGLTQQVLAARLSKSQSFVAKYESGRRSLDIAETFLVLKALRKAPKDALEEIYEANPSFGPFPVRYRERPR
jgi:transcriptional regulator with XRE-family HTH domain